MFGLNKKLNDNLRKSVRDQLYKNYRVLIKISSIPEKIEKKITAMGCKVIYSIPSINCICASVTPRCIDRLLEFPNVRHIAMDDTAILCGNRTVSKLADTNFFTYRDRSHLKISGNAPTIGLIDSGVYPHPDLLNPTRRISSFVDLISEHAYPYDDNGHGTFLAGLMCGSGVSSKKGQVGISPESSLVCVKAFPSSGRGFVSSTLYATHYLIKHSEELNVRVILLPFETLRYDRFIISLYSDLFKIARDKGIIVVVPSGHMGNFESTITGVAVAENCITVAGVENTVPLKPYSQSSAGPFGKGLKPDLSYYCTNINSLNCDTSFVSSRDGEKLYPKKLSTPYVTYTGTSCAAACIAGICALLLQKNPAFTFDDIYSLLTYSCKYIKCTKAKQGKGLVDFDKLFEKVLDQVHN